MPVLNFKRMRYLAHRARHLVPGIFTGRTIAPYCVGVDGVVATAYDGQRPGSVAAFFTIDAAARRAREIGAKASVFRQVLAGSTVEVSR